MSGFLAVATATATAAAAGTNAGALAENAEADFGLASASLVSNNAYVGESANRESANISLKFVI